jgi:hypothetical protein
VTQSRAGVSRASLTVCARTSPREGPSLFARSLTAREQGPEEGRAGAICLGPERHAG